MTHTGGELLAAGTRQCSEPPLTNSGLQCDTQELAELATEVARIALAMQNRFDTAIPLVQRALAVHEEAFGPQHPLVAFSLNTLAGLYRQKGDLMKAEAFYHRALAILENVFGREHPDVATSLDGLARLYQATGEHAKAKLLHNRALRILENVLGPEHPDAAPQPPFPFPNAG
jgi:tetratricopeptide (TPR) repeat protein